MRFCNWLFTLIYLLLPVLVQAAAPIHHWSQRFGGADLDAALALAVDGSGNVIVTGRFRDTADFGAGPHVSAGADDIFLAKYDANGGHLWSKRFGDTQLDYGWALAVDAANNIVLTGYFRGTVDFGGGGLTAASSFRDIFIAKYDANGTYLWSKRIGGTSAEEPQAVCVDSSNNIIVTGWFNDTVDFGGGDLTSVGHWDIFVAKYDASGNHQWSQHFGSHNLNVGQALAIDEADNVIVTGSFYSTVDFGGATHTSAGANDIFLAKFDANGAHQWSQRFGGTKGDDGYGVAVNDAGDVVVTGSFRNTANFGGSDLTSAGNQDIYLAKFDGGGNHQWSKRFGGTEVDIALGIARDLDGMVVAGRFSNTVDFGGGGLTSAGNSHDIFLANYDQDGDHLWSGSFGGTGVDIPNALAVDATDAVLVAGYFSGTTYLGGLNLASAGTDDIFVAKYWQDETVPVFIGAFAARPRGGAAGLRWELRSDEVIGGLTLTRRRGAGPATAIVSRLAPATRSYTDMSVEPGETYHYELVVQTVDGKEFRSQIATITIPTRRLVLRQNSPNPFTPQTTISFTLAEAHPATLTVYDSRGRRVRTLLRRSLRVGDIDVTWDGRDDEGAIVSSGVYFYRLHAGERILTKKMVLLK